MNTIDNEVLLMSYGKRLATLRKKRNLSQEALCEKIGLVRSTYARYETEKTQPDFDTLEKLASFYDVSIDYILGRTDNPKGHAEFDPIAEHNRLLEKYGIEDSGFFDIEKWKQMGPEQLRELESYFQYIVEKTKEKKEDSE